MIFFISLIFVILPMYPCPPRVERGESSANTISNYAILITDLPRLKHGQWEAFLGEMDEENMNALCNNVRNAKIFVFHVDDRGRFESMANQDYSSMFSSIHYFHYSEKIVYVLYCEFSTDTEFQAFFIAKNTEYGGYILFRNDNINTPVGIYTETYKLSEDEYKSSERENIMKELVQYYDKKLLKKKVKFSLEPFQQRKLSVSVFMIINEVSNPQNAIIDPQEWLLDVNETKFPLEVSPSITIDLPYVIQMKFNWPFNLNYPDRRYVLIPFNLEFNKILIYHVFKQEFTKEEVTALTMFHVLDIKEQ